MKAQLYIGDNLASEAVEVMQPVSPGDLIIYGSERLRVRGIGHNLDKKKLQIVCHVPPPKAEEVPEHLQLPKATLAMESMPAEIQALVTEEDTEVEE